jgi:hypothetical protein
MTVLLPSQQSARSLINGEPGAALQVALHAGARAVLIGTGLLLAGVPDKHVIKGALGATLAIEAFVLGYELAGRNQP